MASQEKKKHRNQHPPAVTRAKQAAFLQAYQQTCSVIKAAKAVGIDDNTPYQWAVRNEQFSKRFDELKQEAEKTLIARYENKFDTECLDDKEKLNKVTVIASMFRMKRLDPRYRDNAQVNVNVAGPAGVVMEVIDVTQGRTPKMGAIGDSSGGKNGDGGGGL